MNKMTFTIRQLSKIMNSCYDCMITTVVSKDELCYTGFYRLFPCRSCVLPSFSYFYLKAKTYGSGI